MINRDLKGNIIDQRKKDSHSVEVNGVSRFTGHRFLLKTRLYGDKRCIYCGRWFHWKDTDVLTWLRTKNIDNMNVDGILEPLHCGSEHCQEFHHRYLLQQEKEKQDAEYALFMDLKRRGVIS